MNQYPLMVELLVRERIARCQEAAQRKRVVQSEPPLSHLVALLAATWARRPHPAIKPGAAGTQVARS